MSRCLVVAWLLCAWVLWSYARESGVQSWLIDGAEETKAACETKLADYVRIALDEKPKQPNARKIRVSSSVVRTVSPEGNVIESERFFCLPSGTDPRPRFKE